MTRLFATSAVARLSARSILFLLSPALLGSPRVEGQEPHLDIRVAAVEEVQQMVLRDGSAFYGRVVDAGDPLTFRSISGAEIRVSVDQIRELRTARGEVTDGEFWSEDPNGTRLFFGPTARPLRRGEGYLAVYEIIMPFLAVGVTDNLILSGGTPLFFGGGGGRPFWIAPKFTFLDRGNTQAAVGVLALHMDGENSGVLFGVLTRGDPRRSVTVGLGYGYVGDELADTPVVMVGGEMRASRRMKFVTENYLFPGGVGAISFGPRFIGERLTADLGLVVPVGGESFFAFPLINFVWNF